MPQIRAFSLFRSIDGRSIDAGRLHQRKQLVDDLDSLRDSIAINVLQDIPSASLQTSLETLKDIKERIKGFAEPRDIAAK